MPGTSWNFYVDIDGQNLRVDKYLVGKIPELSRSKIQSLIEIGNLKIDEIRIDKCNYRLTSGQKLNLEIIEEEKTSTDYSTFNIEELYVDSDTIVINKPAGLVVHPGSGHETASIAGYAKNRWPEIISVGQRDRPGIVHRLDKDTSGVLILARSQRAYEWYINLFKTHKIHKTYLGLVDGNPPTSEGRIDVPLLRDPVHRQKISIGHHGEGRNAVTDYCEVERFSDHSLLSISPITGRTHQIRVHMAFVGTPIAGDKVYGKKRPSIDLNRFFLHAYKIEFIPYGDNELTTLTASIPEELKEILNDLRSR